MRDILASGFVVAAVLATACGTTSDLTDKGVYEPRHFTAASEFAAIQVDSTEVCQTGAVAVTFTSPGQAVAYPIALQVGQPVGLETTGDPTLDTVIALYGPDDGTGFYGAVPVAADDDDGAGLLSKLEWVTKAAGAYLAIVSTFQGDGAGTATLHVTVNGEAGCEPAVACHPAVMPKCTLDLAVGDHEVGCDTAFMMLYWDAAGDSPRAKCEARCLAGQTLDGGGCADGTTCSACATIQGMTCEACCLLSDQPFPDSAWPCDGNACTRDWCDAGGCYHTPLDWVGAACEVSNEFGTCTGKLWCDSSLCPPDKPCDYVKFLESGGICDAAVPAADVLDEHDNDCDGRVDESCGPGLAACPAGRFCTQDERCVPQVKADPCTADADCPAGAKCLATWCACTGGTCGSCPKLCGPGPCAPALPYLERFDDPGASLDSVCFDIVYDLSPYPKPTWGLGPSAVSADPGLRYAEGWGNGAMSVTAWSPPLDLSAVGPGPGNPWGVTSVQWRMWARHRGGGMSGLEVRLSETESGQYTAPWRLEDTSADLDFGLYSFLIPPVYAASDRLRVGFHVMEPDSRILEWQIDDLKVAPGVANAFLHLRVKDCGATACGDLGSPPEDSKVIRAAVPPVEAKPGSHQRLVFCYRDPDADPASWAADGMPILHLDTEFLDAPGFAVPGPCVAGDAAAAWCGAGPGRFACPLNLDPPTGASPGRFRLAVVARDHPAPTALESLTRVDVVVPGACSSPADCPDGSFCRSDRSCAKAWPGSAPCGGAHDCDGGLQCRPEYCAPCEQGVECGPCGGRCTFPAGPVAAFGATVGTQEINNGDTVTLPATLQFKDASLDSPDGGGLVAWKWDQYGPSGEPFGFVPGLTFPNPTYEATKAGRKDFSMLVRNKAGMAAMATLVLDLVSPEE